MEQKHPFPGMEHAITEEQLQQAVQEGVASEIKVHMEGRGGGSWAPYIDPAVDYTQWGIWEAWQFLSFGELPDGSVGCRPTGGWIAWNRLTGQQIGFEPKSILTAREQARLLCQAQNGELVLPMKRVRFGDTEMDVPDFTSDRSTWRTNPLVKPTREVVSMPEP